MHIIHLLTFCFVGILWCDGTVSCPNGDRVCRIARDRSFVSGMLLLYATFSLLRVYVNYLYMVLGKKECNFRICC